MKTKTIMDRLLMLSVRAQERRDSEPWGSNEANKWDHAVTAIMGAYEAVKDCRNPDEVPVSKSNRRGRRGIPDKLSPSEVREIRDALKGS